MVGDTEPLQDPAARAERSIHAWGDESMRTVRVDVPAYLLGAVLADPDHCAAIRDDMERLRKSEGKLHWRNLDNRHRDRVIDIVSEFDIRSVVVVGRPLDPRKQERARALCLGRLTWEMNECGVEMLTMEARTSSLIVKDVRTIDGLRRRHVLSHRLRIEHGLPSEEPMLWIADQVLGAFGATLTGENRWFSRLSRSTEVIDIDI